MGQLLQAKGSEERHSDDEGVTAGEVLLFAECIRVYDPQCEDGMSLSVQIVVRVGEWKQLGRTVLDL